MIDKNTYVNIHDPFLNRHDINTINLDKFMNSLQLQIFCPHLPSFKNVMKKLAIIYNNQYPQ